MRRPAALLAISLTLAACSSDAPEGLSDDPGKPVSFPAAAARSGAKTIRLEGVEYGSGSVVVVFAHERQASQDTWTQIARDAAAKGFRALTFNFRGYGVSGGSRAELGLIDLDVEAAVKHARSAGATKVFLAGGAMGGTAALVAATRVAVDGVVGVSASARFMGLDATSVVPKLKVPVLYIAAAGDASAAADARALTALRGDQTREIVTGGGHASELLRGDKGADIRRRILEFIQEISVQQAVKG